MAEPVSAVASLLDQVRTLIPDIGRDLVQWRDAIEENPARLGNLTADVKSTKDLLTSITGALERPVSLLRIHQANELRQRIQVLQSKLTQLLDDIDSLQPSRRRYHLYPSQLRTKLDALLDRHRELESTLEALVSDPQFQSLRDPPIPSPYEDSDDCFRIVMDVELNPPDVILDFSTDANGRPVSYEAQLKQAIFDPQGSNMVGSIAHGLGGVGKTCALRGIGLLPETKERFVGGVLYTSVGREGGLRQLVECIAQLVRKAGGSKTATEILETGTFKNAIEKAGTWFAHTPCLFLIDDVWTVNEITLHNVQQLPRLAMHPQSRIAFTTRDSTITSGQIVRFREREARGKEAEAILLQCSNLQPRSGTEANAAFLNILDKCNGLPIALSVCGRAVRRMAELRCREHPEIAWSLYWGLQQDQPILSSASWDERESFESSVRLSLKLLDKEYDRRTFRDIFASLSIVRKQKTIPSQVASRLWGVSMPDTCTIIGLLENYSLISVYSGNLVSSATFLGIHDVLLDISRAMAIEDGSSLRWSKTLIESYAPSPADQDINNDKGETLLVNGDSEAEHVKCCPPWACRFLARWKGGKKSTSSARVPDMPPSARGSLCEKFEEWWMKVEDDGYIYSNICWLLLQGSCADQLSWLVSNPEWVVRQLSLNGDGQVAEDIEFAIEIISSRKQHSKQEERKLEVKFLRSLQHAAFMGAKSIRETEWEGTPWFQLYGRLIHLAAGNSIARDFLERLERMAPRPFLKPSTGCLPAAGESLRHVIETSKRYLCHVPVDDEVVACYQEYRDICIVRHNVTSGITSAPEVILRHVGGNNKFACAHLTKSVRQVVVGVGGERFDRGGPLKDSGIILCHLDDRRAPEAGVHPAESEQTLEVISRTEQPNSSEASPPVNERYTSPYHIEYVEVPGRYISTVSYSEKGNCLVGGLTDGTVHVMEREGAGWISRVVKGHSGEVRSVAISEDGSRLVSGSMDATVIVLDLKGERSNGRALTGHQEPVTSVSISEDGSRAVSGSWDGTLIVLDLKGTEWSASRLVGHRNWVTSIAITGDGSRVVSGSNDRRMRVWRMEGSGWTSKELEGHTGWVKSVSISEDGSRVVSDSWDGTVRVWEGQGEECGARGLEGHTMRVRGVAVSKDGTRVVSGSDDGSTRVWDLVGSEWTSKVLEADGEPVMCVAISEDGSVLLSGSNDGKVRVWGVEGGEWSAKVLEGHRDWVTDVEISKDKNRVVSGSTDGLVRVWDLEGSEWTGKVLDPDTDVVTRVSMSEDRVYIESRDYDGVEVLWKLVDGEWDKVGVLNTMDEVEMDVHREMMMEMELEMMEMEWESEYQEVGNQTVDNSVPERRPRVLSDDILNQVVRPLGDGTYETVSGYFVTINRAPFLLRVDIVWE